MKFPLKIANTPSVRESKPLHPVLRLVAAFLVFALVFTGPVPMAVAATFTPGTLTVTTSGALSVTNLSQSGSLFSVVAAGSISGDIVLSTGTTGGTLSVGGMVFSGTSAFQDKSVNLSTLRYLQLASGGSLTLPNGMALDTNVPTSGILLGGSATLTVGSSSSGKEGVLGISGGEIRVDSVSTSRGTLTVNTGTATGDSISGVYLDLGAKLDLLKNGRGILGLSSANSGGTLSVFSGTITATAGVLQIDDGFLSQGTSNTLKVSPATGSTLYPVTIALKGTNYLTSLMTLGGSASNSILGVSTDASSATLTLTNDVSDSSVFKGLIVDAADGSDGVNQFYLVKNGNGSLTLSNGNSSFSGGLTLNAGSLILNASSTANKDSTTGITTIAGPIGAHAMSIRGGTIYVKPPFDSDGVALSGINIDNALSFFASTDDDIVNITGGSLIQRRVIISSGSGTDSLTLAGGIDLDSSEAISGGTSLASGSVTLVVSTPVEISGAVVGDPNYGTVLSGSVTMSLVKSGLAQLKLSGANQYLGNLAVAQGTLLLGSTGALGSVDDLGNVFMMNSVSVLSGAVLDLGGFTQAVEAPLILSGTGTGGGALINSGDVTTYSGSLTLAAPASVGGPGDIMLSGLVNVGSAFALTKVDVNTLTFGGSSSFSGSLLVSSGTAKIGSGGTLEFASTGGLVGDLTNNGVVRFNNSAAAIVAGTISGTGSLLKLGNNTLTLSKGATYTGATTISAGSLIVNGGLATSQIANSGTFTWSPGTTTFSGTLSGSGMSLLTSAGTLTLASGAVFSGSNIQIGGSFTLSIGAGATLPGSITVLSGGKLTLAAGIGNVFGSETKLTIITGGTVDLQGNTVSFGSLTGGGSLISTGSQPAIVTSGTSNSGALKFSNVGPLVTVGTFENGVYIRQSGGSLGTAFASGGTSQILLQPIGGGTITLDGTVTAGTSVIASSGSGALILRVQAPVLTPLFDIQSGVSATLLSGASLSSTGTLNVSGNLGLNGGSFAFGKVVLAGGSLYGGTLASGSLAAGSGSLGTSLGASFGNITKTDTGVLSISGSSTAYVGTLELKAGTVKLGNSSALGSTGRVFFGTLSGSAAASATDPVLQLAGNDLTLSSLSGTASGVIENGSSSAVTLTVSPGTANSFVGDIRNGGSGALSLVKSGSGDLTLSGSLTYSGATTVNNGLLLSNTTLPSGSSLNLNGGTLDLGGLTDTASGVSLNGGALRNGTLSATNFSVQAGSISAVLSGSASLIKTGTGSVTLSGTNSYSGGTNVNGGTLSLVGNGALSSGSVNVTAGELALGTTAQTVGLVTLSGGSITGGTLTAASITAGTGTVTAVLSGSGTFTKTTSGTVTLSGANTLTGLMSLQLGTVQVVGNGALTGGSLQISGAVLDLGAAARTSGAVTLSGGSITNGTLNAASYAVQSGSIGAILGGSGDFTKSGTATVTLNGANTLSGTITVQAGTLALSGSGKLSSGSLIISGTSTVLLGGGSQSVGAVTLLSGSIASGTLNGTSFSVQTGSVAAVLGGATAALTKTGNGQVVLRAVNNYGGGTVVNSGTLTLGLDGALSSGSVSVTAGELALGATTQNVAAVTLGGGSITGGTLNAGSFNLQSGVVSSVLGGSGLLTKEQSGLVTLNAVNSLSGNVVISAGTLQLGTGQSLAAVSSVQITGGSLTFGGSVTEATLKSLSGNLSLNNILGGSVTLTLANDGTTTEPGTLSGMGSLVKSGSGNLTLSGTNSYSGTTTVNSGILTTGTGALGTGSQASSAITVNSATLRAADLGSTASLTVTGSGTATIANAGSYGAVSNAGSVTFNSSGTVTLSSLNGTGTTQFNGSAILSGSGVSAGTVTATSGRLQLGTLSGGSVSAATLAVEILSGSGRATATSAATLSSMSGGLLELKGATAILQGSVSGGTVSLSNAAILSVSAGSFTGTATLSGSGTLSKTDSTTFTLTQAIADTIGVNVSAGTLNAGNLLSGSRSIVLAANTQLGVTLSSGTFSGTITAADSTSSLKLSSSAPATLTLGSSAVLSGSITLAGSGVTLNLANAGVNTFSSNTSLTIVNGGTLVLGQSTTQEVDLSSLNLASGSLYISGNGKIYYDTKPSFLTDSNLLVSGTNVVLSGSVGFDTLTQGTLISNGTYQFSAGRVQLTGGTAVSGTLLLLEPKTATTTIRLSSGTITQAIVAGGTSHQGAVSLEGTVFAGSYGNSSGVTTILTNAGSLLTGIASTTPTAITNNGTLKISVTDALKSVANVISGNGTLEKLDSGTLVLSGVNTYSGTSTLSAGVLKLGNSAALGTGSIAFNGGVLNFGTVTADLSGRFSSVLGSNSVAVDTNGNDETFGSGISGSGGLRKLGSGSLTLSVANTFTGGVGVEGGTLVLASAGSLSAGSVTIGAGAELLFARNDSTIYSGSLLGTGSIAQAGAGELTLTGSGSQFTGTFGLYSGTLVLGSNSVMTSGTLVFLGGLLRYANGVSNDVSQKIAPLNGGTAFIDTNGNSVTFAGSLSGSGGLVKLGAGSLTLSGKNTFSGATAVNAGTLTAGTGALANTVSITVSGASLITADFNSNASLSIDSTGNATVLNGGTYGGLNNLGVATFKGGAVTLGSLSGLGATTFAGNVRINTGSISGGSVAVTGSLQANVGGGTVSAASLAAGTLSGGSVTVTGVANANFVSGGSLTVGGGGTLDLVNGGNLALNGASTAIGTLNGGTVAVASNGTLTVKAGISSGVISGSGSFVKDGSGSLAMNSAGGLAVTGSVVVNAGTLNVVDLATNLLSVKNGAQASVSAAGTYGAVNNAGSVGFAGGSVALSSLSGNGVTNFTGNASIVAGSISAGSVTVGGALQANVSNGTVSTVTLVAGTLSGGSVTVSGTASANVVNGGVLTVGGSAALVLVGSGNVNLNGATSTITTLNGGSVTVGGGTLTVTSGGSAGVVSGSGSLVKEGTESLALNSVLTGSVTVKAGTLSAVNYAQNSLLTVSGGQLLVSGSGLTLGTLSNSNVTKFTADSGTITLGSLTGSGTTTFASNATLSSSVIGDGIISANLGRLQLATLSGGSVSAANLVLGTLNGGFATAISAGSITSMTAGSFTLNGGAASVTSLAGGSIAVNNSAVLNVASGSFSGVMSGTGTLSKTGNGTLDVRNADLSSSINLSVFGGTLQATNITATSNSIATSVTLGAGGTLALTIQTGTYTGAVTATAKTAAINLSSSTPVTLSLSGTNAKLDGAITLANSGITLDFSGAGISPLGSYASLTVVNGGTLALGTTNANRELDLNTITVAGGSLTLSGNGKLLYDTKPAFLTDSNTLVSGTNVVIASGGSITFDVLTQGTFLSSGTYQYFAGKVKPLTGTDTFLTANRLLLDPKSATTTIRVAGGTFNDSIVVGGSSQQGIVSIEGSVYAGSLGIASGATTVLTDAGSLLVGTGSAAAATPITNNGTFQASSSSGIKTVANIIGGSGSFEKIGSGTLVLAGSSSYTGTTTLSNGVLTMGTYGALGTLGSIVFKGGALQYGSGVTTDLSARISGSLSTSSVAIDTNGNSVVYNTGLGGTVGFAKLGSGKLTLNAANTFSGGVSISAGTLELASAGSLAAVNVDIASGSLLRFNRADAASFAGSFSGAGAVEKANTGVLTLSGSGSGYTGIFSLSGGTLVLGNAAALSGTLAFKGGVFQYGAGITTDISSGIASLTEGSAKIDTGTNSVTFAGSLSGTGGLVKTGLGNLTLASGSNSFSGATVVNGGSLTTTAGALANTGGITVSGASLNAVDFKSTASLAVDASGSAIVSGTGISTGTVTNSNSVSFTATTGKITLAALNGTGTTSFSSDAKINGSGVTQGSVTVSGSLQSSVSGGTVKAATFASDSVSNGSLTVTTGSASIGTVSGGVLTLNGSVNGIAALNGGTITQASGVLTVQGGSTAGVVSGSGSLVKDGTGTLSTGAGGLALTGGITVNIGTLNAVDYASASLMTVGGSGRLSVSGIGLSLGTLSNSGIANFTATTGTITLASLLGNGVTQFAGNAIFNSSVSSGVVTAGGRLQLPTLNGGSVTAANLVLGTLNSGAIATGTTTGSLGILSGGSLNLAGAQFTVGTLSTGTVTLSNASKLTTTSSGTFTGSIFGSGTLVKEGSATLTLGNLPVETIAVSVLGGSLTAGNLLSGSRSLSVASGANLNLALTTGSYSGTLTGLGTTLLSGSAGAILSVGSSASLDGALKLDGGYTLDLSSGNTNKFGSNATLTITNGGSLIVGGPSQELELGSLIVSSGLLVLTSNGGKILYDNKPVFLGTYGDTVTLNSGSVISVGSSTVTIVGGSVTFDVLTQGTLLSGSVSGGSYQYTAGRVQLKGGTAITASSLLLDPKLATTTIRMSAGTVSGSIVLGGTSHQGILSVEGTVTAGSLGVTSNTTAKFTQAGSLQATSAGGATAISNSGALQFSVTDGSKTVANLISGTGSVEKVDAGILQLSGINTYSGNTVLSGGTAVLQNVQSFGTGSVVFNGGALQYGSGMTTDLSSRIASLGSGTIAVVDTNGNLVNFATGLTGSGGVKKSGNGTLALAGSNTFSGGIEVASGTVQVGSGSSGSLASATTVDSGALLKFARTDSVTYSGALTGSGTVEQVGAGTLTLSGNNSSFTGTTVLSNGVLSVATTLALGTSGSVSFNGGVLQYGTGVATDLSSKISPVDTGKTATIDTNGNNITFASALSGAGSFVKMGSGSITFNAANALATTVKAGTLVYNGVSSGSVALTGGAVAYNLNGSTLSGNVVSSAGTNVSLNNSGDTNGTFSGVVSGAGSLLTSGNILLTSSQKNTGGVTISGGSLALGTTSNAVSLGGTGSIITIASGATLDAVNGSFDSSSSLVLGGTASTLKLGEVTLSLNNFTLSSGTALSATSSGGGASILVSGSISIGGTLQTYYTSTDGLVSVGTVSKGKSGYTSLTSTSGTLKGTVSGGSYDSLSTTVASNLKISSNINVLDGVNIGSGSMTLTSSTLSAASVSIGSGSGGAALTVGSGAAIKSDSVTFTSGTLKLSGSIGAATEGGGVVSFGGTSNSQAATVTLDSGAVITAKTVSFNSGSLTMSGSIAASGGDVSFGSTSSGGVAAAITLSGSSASIAATKVKLNGGSTLTLDQDAVKALDGVKALEVGGAGSSGTLTIASGTFTVASGNTLKGSGTIIGTVKIGAGSVLSPGNSPGTLSIGTATLASGATLVLEHGVGTNVDKLTGTSLTIESGGTISLIDYERSLLSGTSSYTPFASGLAIAPGTVNVTVSVRLGSDTGTVGDTGVAYTIAESALYSGNYIGGTISVTATSLAALAASNNLSGNALTVAKALDSRLAALAASGTFAVTAVDQIGTGATRDIAKASLPAQLAAANPSGYAELAGLSTQRVLNLNQVIVDHLRSLRADLLDPQDSNLTGWLSTYGSWQKQNGNATQGIAGFSGNTWGSLFGVEKRVGDLTFGVDGATGQTTADFQALTGHISTDAWHVGVYAVARMGDVVLESNALVGLTDTTARRTIAATGLTSREGKLSVKGTEWLFNTGAALPLIVPGSWTITPSARLVVQGQNQDSAKESDLSGLEVSLSRQNTTSVLHQAGVELRKQLSLAGKSAAASLNTDWIHNYNAKGRDLNMAFGTSSMSFGYKGSDSGADAIRVSGALEAALTGRTTLRLSLDYQAQTRASSTNGSVSLGYNF